MQALYIKLDILACPSDHFAEMLQCLYLCMLVSQPLSKIPNSKATITMTFSLIFWQHCASASPYPKRKQVCEILLRKGASINDKTKE